MVDNNPMTAVEKILARALGPDHVQPGDIIFPDPEIIIIHDALVLPSKRKLDFWVFYQSTYKPDIKSAPLLFKVIKINSDLHSRVEELLNPGGEFVKCAFRI